MGADRVVLEADRGDLQNAGVNNDLWVEDGCETQLQALHRPVGPGKPHRAGLAHRIVSVGGRGNREHVGLGRFAGHTGRHVRGLPPVVGGKWLRWQVTPEVDHRLGLPGRGSNRTDLPLAADN